jgi:hypothetical protein
MTQLFDLDVRVLAPIGWPRSPEAVLGDIACAVRVARLRGIDAIGAVGRFSSLRGPGVLEALRDAAGEGGLFRPPGRAGARRRVRGAAKVLRRSA